MCLFIDINQHKDLKPKIAKQDIFAYKVLLYSSNRKEFYTPCMNVSVDVNTNFKCSVFQNTPHQIYDRWYIIDEAIHLRSNLTVALRDAQWYVRNIPDFGTKYTFACVYRVALPKRNKYWVGIHNDICTESISFKDMVAVFCDSFVNTGRDSTFLQKECIALLRDGVNEDILLRFFYSIDVEKIIRECTEAELGILEPTY